MAMRSRGRRGDADAAGSGHSERAWRAGNREDGMMMGSEKASTPCEPQGEKGGWHSGGRMSGSLGELAPPAPGLMQGE